MPESVGLSQEIDMGRRPKTHRGRRSKGKGHVQEHHDQAKAHMAAAQKAKDPAQAHAHLFRAITSLNKCR